MLDLSHPRSRHVFAASRAEDAVLIACRDMTTASRAERRRLRAACEWAFAELRRLNAEHFGDRIWLRFAVGELELAVGRLAELGPAVPESGPRAEYRCPVCDDELNRLNQFGFPMPVNPELIYCGRCLNVIMPALTVLRSSPDGFGTDAI